MTVPVMTKFQPKVPHIINKNKNIDINDDKNLNNNNNNNDNNTEIYVNYYRKGKTCASIFPPSSRSVNNFYLCKFLVGLQIINVSVWSVNK